MQSGDLNHYRFVSNNPVKYTDPSGLVLQYGCEKSRKELEDDIERIRSTEHGRYLLELLEKSDTVFTLQVSFNEATASFKKNTIYIDPNLSSIVHTNYGPVQATTTRILAHELGHLATGTLDDGYRRLNNVILNENPIMGPLEGNSRNTYGTYH